MPIARVPRLIPAMLMAAGLGLWVYTAGWLTPAVARIHEGDDDPGELHIWVQEQRELAIVLIAAALVIAVLRRGPVALPAIVAAVGLFVADAIVDNVGLAGWRAVVVLLAVAAGVLAGAVRWSVGWGRSGGSSPAGLPASVEAAGEPEPSGGPDPLAARLVASAGASDLSDGRDPLTARRAASAREPGLSGGRDPLAARRAAAATALVAALVAPALAIDFQDVDAFTGLPTALVPVAAAIMILLWGAAVTLASAARPEPLSTVALAAWFAIPAAVLVAIELLPGGEENAPSFGAGTVLAISVLGIARGWSSWRARRWTLWMVGALLAIPVYFLASFMFAQGFGPLAMRAAGYDYPSDGIPYLPGALPLAIVVGMALALLVAPYPAGQPTWWHHRTEPGGLTEPATSDT